MVGSETDTNEANYLLECTNTGSHNEFRFGAYIRIEGIGAKPGEAGIIIRVGDIAVLYVTPNKIDVPKVDIVLYTKSDIVVSGQENKITRTVTRGNWVLIWFQYYNQGLQYYVDDR